MPHRGLSRTKRNAGGAHIGTFYLKAESVVAYMIQEFGVDSFQRLIGGLAQGRAMDQALTQAYGFDLSETGLPDLIARILAETTIDRLRVSSLQAQEITTELLDLWQDPRLCPHLHIPLQCGSDTILRSMRRRYDTARFAETVELVRERVPNAGITTDMIVGFPGEGVREFAESHSFAASVGFSGMHVFPYSIRPGTSAAHLDGQVDDVKKRERTGEMLELAAAAAREFRLGALGQTRSVLWEPAKRPKRDESGGVWSGLTDNYLRVRTQSDRDLGNVITGARLTAVDEDWVMSEVV